MGGINGWIDLQSGFSISCQEKGGLAFVCCPKEYAFPQEWFAKYPSNAPIKAKTGNEVQLDTRIGFQNFRRVPCWKEK